MSTRRLTLIALALVLTACGSNPARPAVADADAKAIPGTTPTAPVEGKRIEGVSLTPGIAEIAKKEGQVDLIKDERVKCEKYTPLGSHRTKYRCTTLAEDAKSKEDNNAAMRKIQTPPPSEGARTIGN